MSKTEQTLFDALRKEDLYAAEEIIKLGANPNAEIGIGVSLLHYALRKNHENIAVSLINHGADINGVGGDGVPTLGMAVLAGAGRVVSLLIKKGANVSAVFNGLTPVFLCVLHKKKYILKDLLNAGADMTGVGLSSSALRFIPLLLALAYGYDDFVKMLAERLPPPTPDECKILPILDAVYENQFVLTEAQLSNLKATFDKANNLTASDLFVAGVKLVGSGSVMDLGTAAQILSASAERGYVGSATVVAGLLINPTCPSYNVERSYFWALISDGLNLHRPPDVASSASREIYKTLLPEKVAIIQRQVAAWTPSPQPQDLPSPDVSKLTNDELIKLARKHRSGDWMPVDEKKAFYYFRAAAARGDVDANFWLGGDYMHGLGGLEKNQEKAFGHYKACYDVLMTKPLTASDLVMPYILYYPLCLLWGIGCVKDLTKSWQALVDASARGFTNASNLINNGKVSGLVMCLQDFEGHESLSGQEILDLFKGVRAN